MTTTQRVAISTPVDGLIVYDTDLKSFYHYNIATTTWIRIGSEVNGRLKFKLIKSIDVLSTVLATELAAGGGTKYLLDTTTYYEVNGTLNFSFPIELNNAYFTGLDVNEDKVIKTGGGDLFVGSTGGTIRVLTLVAPTSGNSFNLIGTGAVGTNTQNFIFRDAIVASCANVGKIENFSLVFISIIQYSGNTTGIIYKDISRLLLSNTGWFGNNTGTFETIQGTTGLITKQGGFSEANGTAVCFDVSSNPVITVDGAIEGCVFTGNTRAGYIKGYSPAIYTGFSFNNLWNIRTSGVPNETDANAVGDINFDYPVGSGAVTSVPGTGTTSRIKLAGVTTSNNLFRFSRGGLDNRLVYLGRKKRFVSAVGSVSYQSSQAPSTFIFML